MDYSARNAVNTLVEVPGCDPSAGRVRWTRSIRSGTAPFCS